MRIMVNNLEAEMKRIGVTRQDIAGLLGLTYRTIHSRFSGVSEWRYCECVKIRNTYFPGMELEYLFTADNKTD